MYGHWNIDYVGEFEPNDWFGFIYCIEDNLTGKKYIGKKQFQFTNRKKVKGRKNRKVVKSDSGWREYTGTSDELNEDIEKLGKERFNFYIIKLCKTKGDLNYSEVEEQFNRNVLYSLMEDGNKEYYNKNIMNRWFYCRGHSNKTREKITKSLKGKTHSDETKKKMSETRKTKGLSQKENNPMYKKFGEEHPSYGKPLSKETKNKISKYHKGKLKSEETKEKMSETRRKYWENNKGKIWVTNDQENKRIDPSELDYYLNLGFRRGQNQKIRKA